MSRKIYAVGPTTQNNKVLNGLTMMFQLLVDELEKRKEDYILIDIGISRFNSGEERTSGAFSFTKLVNYAIIITHAFFTFLLHRRGVVYLTTAQSKVGFIRDYCIIRLARLFGNRVIGHQFGSNYGNFYKEQSPFFKELIRKTLSRTERMIVEGNYTKEQFSFLPDYKEKVYSLPNGLPEKIDTTDITAKTIDPRQPTHLFYLSNLIETKGFWDVLEAVRILIQDHGANVYAVFSGKFLNSVDDSKFPDAMAAEQAFHVYLAKHNLKERVVYYNGLYGTRKAEEFRKAHFFLLPSYYINEGQPVSTLEALAYGCVPIVTEYRLIPMMVNRENGFFVAPQSPSAIVAAVLDSLAHPQKYHNISQAGIDTYLEKFTAEKYTAHLISFF